MNFLEHTDFLALLVLDFVHFPERSSSKIFKAFKFVDSVVSVLSVRMRQGVAGTEALPELGHGTNFSCKSATFECLTLSIKLIKSRLKQNINKIYLFFSQPKQNNKKPTK